MRARGEGAKTRLTFATIFCTQNSQRNKGLNFAAKGLNFGAPGRPARSRECKSLTVKV
jgi:hypothetical protein